MTNAVSPMRKHSLFQFTLRTLLVLLTVFCVWLAIEARKVAHQKRAVEAIGQLGGSVSYDYQFDDKGLSRKDAVPPAPEWLRGLIGDDFFQTVVGVSLASCDIDDNDLSCLQHLTRLRSLSLNGTSIDGSGLRHVRNARELDTLDLNQTNIGDAGIQHVRGLTNLQYLGLMETHITDAGLEYLTELAQLNSVVLDGVAVTDHGLTALRGFSNLESINLDRTRITDAGIAHLEQFPKLSWLTLGSTSIGDEGAIRLRSLPALRKVKLTQTKVTASSFLALQKALPNCEIEFEMVALTNAQFTDARWKWLSKRIISLDKEGRLKLLSFSGAVMHDDHIQDLEALSPGVQVIDLTGAQLSETAMRRLKKALPDCEIRH